MASLGSAEKLVPRLRGTETLARRLLASYGLTDWTFVFNRRKREMGLCVYDSRTIALSVHFVALNDELAVQDTLLHEIAHALVGPGHGHDAIWKQKCLEVGAKPERLGEDANMPIGVWQARCQNCGTLHHRHRRPKHMIGWWCRHCGRKLGRLTWQLAG